MSKPESRNSVSNLNSADIGAIRGHVGVQHLEGTEYPRLPKIFQGKGRDPRRTRRGLGPRGPGSQRDPERILRDLDPRGPVSRRDPERMRRDLSPPKFVRRTSSI